MSRTETTTKSPIPPAIPDDLLQADKQAPAWRTYRNQDYDFEIQYPSQFTISVHVPRNRDSFLWVGFIDPRTPDVAQFSIAVLENPDHIQSPDSFLRSRWFPQQYTEQLGTPTTINNLQTLPYGPVNRVQSGYLIWGDLYVYDIANYLAPDRVFSKSLHSFKLITAFPLL